MFSASHLYRAIVQFLELHFGLTHQCGGEVPMVWVEPMLPVKDTKEGVAVHMTASWYKDTVVLEKIYTLGGVGHVRKLVFVVPLLDKFEGNITKQVKEFTERADTGTLVYQY